MIIPGTTIEVLKSFQKEGLSVQQIAGLMGTSAKSVYEALRGNAAGETGILAIQLYIKLKLANADKRSLQKKLSQKIAIVSCRIRIKKSPTKNKLIRDIVDTTLKLQTQAFQFKHRFNH